MCHSIVTLEIIGCIRWEEVKEIPVDVRMATPFQHGNVCEDPRAMCDALEKKGGNPRWKYLSAVPRLYSVSSSAAIYHNPPHCGTPKHRYRSRPPELLFNPQYTEVLAEQILGQVDANGQRGFASSIICKSSDDLSFQNVRLSKKTYWRSGFVNWQGNMP